MSEITYGYGTWEDYDGIVALCATWWEDSEFYKNTNMPFKVDKEKFKTMYDSDGLFILIGTDEDSEIVACYISYLDPYIFNKDVLVASEVVWCLHKDYRKGREVFNLISAIETGLTHAGVDMFNLNMPQSEGKEVLQKYLLKKKGFWSQDNILMKEIKHG